MDERGITALERIAAALERIADAGSAGAPTSAHTTAAHLPTFCGMNCSYTTDTAGRPSYVITPDGEIAEKHERQGDCWWSVKEGDSFRRIVTIKAGEVLPPEAQFRLPDPPAAQATPPPPPAAAPTQPDPPQERPPAAHVDDTPAPSLPPPESRERQAHTTERAQAAAAVPQAEAPDDADPFSQVEQDTLTRLHEIGRKAHGEEQWRKIGPERILAHSDGRATSSDQLSHQEAIRLINELLSAAIKSPAYSG